MKIKLSTLIALLVTLFGTLAFAAQQSETLEAYKDYRPMGTQAAALEKALLAMGYQALGGLENKAISSGGFYGADCIRRHYVLPTTPYTSAHYAAITLYASSRTESDCRPEYGPCTTLDSPFIDVKTGLTLQQKDWPSFCVND